MASEVIAGTVQEAVNHALRMGQRVIQVEAGTVLTADRFALPGNVRLALGAVPAQSRLDRASVRIGGDIEG
jgi:hypothetical protein